MGIITGDEVVEACGSDQLCSGVKGGIEGAVHAISETFYKNTVIKVGTIFERC